VDGHRLVQEFASYSSGQEIVEML